MSYFRLALSGISWSVGQRWVVRGFTIIRLGILARILTPAQFGVFGVATLILGFLETFTETSINVFLIQEKSGIDKYINTAWIISNLRGIAIGLLIFFGAGPISAFFNSPQSLPVLQLMALVPIFRGMINPSVAKMQKNLLFKNEFAYKISLFFIDALVSIGLSLWFQSAVGLVWGMLASAIFEVGLSFCIFSPKPIFSWDKSAAAAIFSRGKWITAAGILNYFYQNADNLVVGRQLGEANLGIYSSAYKLSSLPVSEVSDVISRVTFPVYVRIYDTSGKIKSVFLRSSLAVFSVSALLGLLIFVLAEPIVGLVLGPNWVTAIPVLKLLTVYGVIKSFTNTIYPLFLATRKQQYVTFVNLSSSLGLGITILPFVSRWGIMGAAYAAIVGAAVAIPFSLYFAYATLKTDSVSKPKS